MSNKTSCPACDSHTSGIWEAFNCGLPCPVCGLAAEVYLKIEMIRRSHASDEAKAEAESALKRAGTAEAELSRVRRKLAALTELVQRPLAEFDSEWTL